MSSNKVQLESGCQRRLNSRGRHAAVLLLLVCTYWFFGFYPFLLDAPSPNSARSSEDGALVFEGRGLAVTKSAPGWLRQAIEHSSLQLELDVRSFDSSQFGPARILTISRDYQYRNLTVAQEGSDLIVRLRRPGSTPNGTPPYVVGGVFNDDRPHQVSLLIERGDIRLTVDGELQVSESFEDYVLASWIADYRVAIGNEVIAGRPWLGELRHATLLIDGISIDLLDLGAVEIPANWWYVPERLKWDVAPPSLSGAAAVDIAVNLVGFFPLGGFLFWRFGNRVTMLRGILGAATVSLSIEFGQIFLAGRYPSVIDFCMNVLGAWIGWLLVARLCRRWNRLSLPPSNNQSQDAGISAK